MKITTYEQAEAATEAARRCYERIIIQTSEEIGSMRELSRRIGQHPSALWNIVKGGQFAALRRAAAAIQTLQR